MEGVVAKRTLKKSYYNRNCGVSNNIQNVDNLINGSYSTSNTRKKSSLRERKFFSNFKDKMLYRMSIQAISVIAVAFFIVSVNVFNIEVVKAADITKKTSVYIKKKYTVSQILEGTKNTLKKTYKFVKPVVPEKIENKVITTYNKLKEQVLKNNLDKVSIYGENNNIKTISEKKESNNVSSSEEKIAENIGGSVDDANTVVSVISSTSTVNDIAKNIKSTGVKFTKPVEGVVTSKFGAREAIFEGIDSYHTGTDIGADKGTKVVSSIDGKITKAEYNKYNGNYIEITNGKIITKYCHLSKSLVKVGATVRAGEKIGEVGSTGLSTGPHLHFEIVYDSKKIDPEQIVEL